MFRKILLTLFLMSVTLLPLVVWRIIGLPINHGPLIINLDGFVSASLFGLTFFVLLPHYQRRSVFRGARQDPPANSDGHLRFAPELAVYVRGYLKLASRECAKLFLSPSSAAGPPSGTENIPCALDARSS